MEPKTTVLIAAGTVATALGIGAAMQYWPSQYGPSGLSGTPVIVSDVLEVSSTPKAPLPVDVTMEARLPAARVSNPVDTPDPAEIALPDGATATAITRRTTVAMRLPNTNWSISIR